MCLKTDHYFNFFFSFISLVFVLRDNRTKLIYTMLLSVSLSLRQRDLQTVPHGGFKKKENHPNHRNTGTVRVFNIVLEMICHRPSNRLTTEM